MLQMKKIDMAAIKRAYDEQSSIALNRLTK